MVGIIRIVKARAPINPEKDLVIGYKIAERINKPATIDGTPLIAWTRKRIGAVNLPLISVKYRAVKIPIGTLIINASVTRARVPVMA